MTIAGLTHSIKADAVVQRFGRTLSLNMLTRRFLPFVTRAIWIWS